MAVAKMRKGKRKLTNTLGPGSPRKLGNFAERKNMKKQRGLTSTMLHISLK
jgi:hypothetical protein